ncbi:hypothetical protein PAXINDRAFT_21305 [Paxillus involutus ATCC 200175]|uniref:Uncharacterized protein n=1 Tax=Paxillus involutus ATCC 200175 TaxID=664439 RepID=A0A0C9SM26_PAXIN|nr:hypothetical protein PAXINDRAFT_21304 [Paxillus involutus ATCC 200175]KIJ05439.1 hypothetical protein PAXINDRAFT_21305 [Paxillus involutus ATCC 200175]
MAPTQMEEEDPFTDDGDEEAQTDEDHSEDDQDNEATASDFEEMMRVLNIPGPSAEVADLQKALALAQCMYTETHMELWETKKKLLSITYAVPPWICKHVFGKNMKLNGKIVTEAKKYAMFYHFWVLDGLFPTSRNGAQHAGCLLKQELMVLL